jgi:serine/threonine-protein kinase HipA
MSYDSLTVLDRLSIVGHGGMGALIYDPQLFASIPRLAHLDLDAIAAETFKILRGEQDGDVVELERLGGSSGGARPKITAFMDESSKRISSGYEAGLEPWMIKFRYTNDFDDIGPLEAAYADMARAAGLEMAPTRLLQSSSGPGFFATKRFDRKEEGAVRLHMASAAGLHDIDWRTPGAISYDTLLKIVGFVTREHPDIEQMFRRMVYNVLATNRDDHPKQHAFLMTATGKWRLAPAFDLTYAPGPNGQHYLDVDGKGNQVTAGDLRAVGTAHAVRNIDSVIDEVSKAVRQFSTYARRYGVSEQTYDRVAKEIALRFDELDAPRTKESVRRRATAERER